MNEPLIPWYFAGPLLGSIVILILLLSGKQLGISSSYRALLSYITPSRVSYFNYARENDLWQVWFAIGLILASLFHFQILETSPQLQSDFDPYKLQFALQFFLGGILVGFGARYANGCTAGHCIMGNAQFALSSIIATIGFFAGGLAVTHFFNDFLFGL